MKRIWIYISIVILFLTGVIAVYIIDRNRQQESGTERADIALAICDADTPRMVALLQDVQEKSREEDKQLAWRAAGGDLEQQKKDIRELLTMSPEYLVVVPVKTIGLEGILQEVDQEKTRIILLDRTIDNYRQIPVLAEVSTDARWEGEMCGWLLQEYFSGENGFILEVQGEEGSSLHKHHSAGFRSVLSSFDNLQIAGVVKGSGSRIMAQNNVEYFLVNENRQVNAVFASSDEEGLGALAALVKLGLAGQIPIVSVGGIQDAKKAVYAGGYYGCVEATPYLGETLLGVIRQDQAGVSPEYQNIVRGEVYTLDTISDMKGY